MDLCSYLCFHIRKYRTGFRDIHPLMKRHLMGSWDTCSDHHGCCIRVMLVYGLNSSSLHNQFLEVKELSQSENVSLGLSKLENVIFLLFSL